MNSRAFDFGLRAAAFSTMSLCVLSALFCSAAIGQDLTIRSALLEVPVLVTADRWGSAVLGDGAVVALNPRNPVELHVPSGRHRLRAVSDVGELFWETTLDVEEPGPLKIRIDFAGVARAERAADLRLAALRETTEQNEKQSAALEKRKVEAPADAARAQRQAELELKTAMRNVERIVAEIQRLETELQAFSQSADNATAEGRQIEAQSSTQGSATTLEALNGLLGKFGAARARREAWRNQMRARGVLIRMDRLTGYLSDASEYGIDRLPDSPFVPSVYPVFAGKIAGILEVADGRIAYRESRTAAPVNMPCADIKGVAAAAKSLTIKTKGPALTVAPVNSSVETVLSEIFFACKEKDF